jgi:hypothetical protein
MKALSHVILLAMVALLIGFIAMVAGGSFAKAQEPAGFAEAQRAAFWKAIQNSPQLVGVDQVVIEGDGNGPIMTGWLQKKSWIDGKLTNLERRFWTRIDRICSEIKPECFRCVGIWSNGQLVAHMTAEK